MTSARTHYGLFTSTQWSQTLTYYCFSASLPLLGLQPDLHQRRHRLPRWQCVLEWAWFASISPVIVASFCPSQIFSFPFCEAEDWPTKSSSTYTDIALRVSANYTITNSSTRSAEQASSFLALKASLWILWLLLGLSFQQRACFLSLAGPKEGRL